MLSTDCAFINVDQYKQQLDSMSRTSIDFFSRGLETHKTKLTVSLYNLNAQYDFKSIQLKKKSSLNFSRSEKKNLQHRTPFSQQHVVSEIDSKLAQDNTDLKKMSISSYQANPKPINFKIKKSVIQFEGVPFHHSYHSEENKLPPKVIKRSNKKTDIGQQNEQEQIQQWYKNRQTKSFQQKEELHDNLDKKYGKYYLTFRKITQQCENKEQSYLTEHGESNVNANGVLKKSPDSKIGLEKKFQNTRDSTTENFYDYKKNKTFYSNHSAPQVEEKSKNFYFIRNLVLQSENVKQKMIEGQNVQRFTTHRFHPSTTTSRYLTPIKYQSIEQQKRSDIMQPNSLKSFKITYNSSNKLDEKQRLKKRKSILYPIKLKDKVRGKKESQFGVIDRWEYNKEENGWEI